MTDDSPALSAKWILKLSTRFNVLVYRLRGSRLLNEFSGVPICLVDMTGAKSRKKRTIPLMYVSRESGIMLVASQGGAQKTP